MTASCAIQPKYSGVSSAVSASTGTDYLRDATKGNAIVADRMVVHARPGPSQAPAGKT